MLFRALAAIAAASFLIVPGAVASAAGTVVLTPHGGKPQTFSGAQLLLQSPKLVVSLPNRQLIFDQSSCTNTEQIMECQPIAVSIRTKAGTKELNVTEGLGYFNLTKIPQPIGTEPPQKLPRHGLFITLHTDEGAKIEIRGTLDAGASVLTGN